MPPARCSLLETIPNNGGGGVLRIPADGAQPIQFDRLSFEPTRHSILAPPLITLGAHSQFGPKARYAQIEGPGAPQERPHIRIRVFYCAATDAGSGHLVRNSRVPGAVGDVYVCKLLKRKYSHSICIELSFHLTRKSKRHHREIHPHG